MVKRADKFKIAVSIGVCAVNENYRWNAREVMFEFKL